MTSIVDIQGFNIGPKDFIPKEIAIQCSDEVLVILVEPPCPYKDLSALEKIKVDWVEQNRKIFWEGGFVRYKNFKNCVQFLWDKKVFVKGIEKAGWINDMLEDRTGNKKRKFKKVIHNLEDYGCPSFSTLYERYNDYSVKQCNYHPGNCAFTNVHYLMKWSDDNKLFD